MSKMKLISKRRVITTRAAAAASIASSNLLIAMLACSLRCSKPSTIVRQIFHKNGALTGAR